MKAVVQRVVDASVAVDSVLKGAIDKGLLIYFGVEASDTLDDIDFLVRKISKLRIFRDENDKMNLSVQDVGKKVLIISQFTLCADLSKGNRPSFDNAANPKLAEEYYETFCSEMEKTGLLVERGVFGAHMHVVYENDGPVTIIYDTKKEKRI